MFKLLTAALVLELFVAAGHGFSRGGCEKPSILASKNHSLYVIGDNSYIHSYRADDNREVDVLSVEGHLRVRCVSKLLGVSSKLPEPYIAGSFQGWGQSDQKASWKLGMGVEWWPFSQCRLARSRTFGWIRYLRSYLAINSITHRALPQERRSGSKLRIGIDMYAESGIHDVVGVWRELWADLSWRESDSDASDPSGCGFAIAAKLGPIVPPRREWGLMPYVGGELAVSGGGGFRQNQARVGMGMQVMPFRWTDGTLGVFGRTARLYLEGLKIVRYFTDEGRSDRPDEEIRIGINCAIAEP